RAKLDMMKRNALIAAGNAMTKTEFSEVRKRVNAIALDDTESDLVRETAQSIVMRLEAEDR
ncbi:MAG: hypothetical protein O7G85_08020, partial [Planctomycetota bacterium]|nr:hypothetical protein [Planctomycetota bacterium]